MTSFAALQEEIAGLSFKLVDWEERARAAQLIASSRAPFRYPVSGTVMSSG